jgi:hypothetical protein
MRSSRAVQSIIPQIFSERMARQGEQFGRDVRRTIRIVDNNCSPSLSQPSASPAKTMQDKTRTEDAVSPRSSQHTSNLHSDSDYRYSHGDCPEWHAYAARPRTSP